jgi:sterol 3beta-glucosyltransferase
MDFSETIEVKVLETQPGPAQVTPIDSYFFAYFHDLAGALEQIRSVVRVHRSDNEHLNGNTVLDTTIARDREDKKPIPSSTSSLSTFRLPNLRILRPFQESRFSQSVPENFREDFTHVSRRTNSESFVPVTENGEDEREMANATPTPTAPTSHHTYPPPTTTNTPESSSTWGTWWRGSMSLSGVKEVYSSPSTTTASGSRWGNDLAFSILDAPDGGAVDDEMTQKFRSAFAYDERETLLGCKCSYLPGVS